MRRISLLSASAPALLVAALLPLASCESAAGPKLGSYALAGVSGDAQTSPVGEPLPAPLRVRLMAGERPMSGINVYWATDSGMLDGETSRTDVNGYSSIGWSMGPKPGAYHAVAQVPNVGSVRFTATATVGPFARLRLAPATLTLADVGDTATLSAAATDRFGNAVDRPPVTWTTRAAGIATVSSAGLVRGVNGGAATIVGSALGITDSALVTVQQQPASVALVTETALIRSIRGTTTLQANVLDRLGNLIPGSALTWSTLDPLTVAVNAAGTVTGVAAGAGRVRAAAGPYADTAIVTVVQVPKRITMLPATATLPAGDSMLIQPTVYDSLGSIVPGPELTWYTDTIVARVLGNGWVRGVSTGSARVFVNAWYERAITAVAFTQLTVRAGPIVRVTVQPDTATLRVGDTRSLTVTATDSLGNVAANPAVLWTSSDTTRVRVSNTGVVTGRALGTATISATVAGVTGTATINVASALPASVRVTRDRDTLNYIGATRQLTAYVYDGFGMQIPALTPAWSTLDPTVMTISAAGLVTELAGGGALARAVASYTGLADTVTVVLRQVPRAINVAPTTLALAVGDSSAVTLTVGVDSGGAAILSTAANESNTAVARVRWTGGVPYIVAIGAGSATIQFYAGGANPPAATVNVTVTAPGASLVPVQPRPGLRPAAASPARRAEGDAAGI